jgi:Ig domain of plant-specific actin-binding protein
MTPLKLGGRRWPTSLLLALAALAVGAVFGTAQNGSASSAVKPGNVTSPVISGTAEVGQTLISTDGTWNGTAPISFTYQWDRCDATGENCAPISGATTNTYTVQPGDVGNTIQSNVTGTNSDGVDHQPSVATAVVTTAPVTGCPSGTGTIQVTDLSPPARLAIDQQTVTPGTVTLGASSIQVGFRVTACGGRPVQGALLYVTAVPFNQYSIPPEATTGSDGTVALTMNQQSGFPAARHQQLLVMFVRARRASDPLEAGISGRVLVSFPFSLK